MSKELEVRNLQVVAAHAAGESQGSIARRLGISRPRVTQIITAHREKIRAESAHASKGQK